MSPFIACNWFTIWIILASAIDYENRNTMEPFHNKNQLLDAFLKAMKDINEELGISYIEVLSKNGEDIQQRNSLKFSPDFTEIQFKDIMSRAGKWVHGDTLPRDLSFGADGNHHCRIYPLETNGHIYGFCIFQKRTHFNTGTEMLLSFIVKALHLLDASTPVEECENKREDLNRIRGIQAALFPRMEHIDNYDTAAIYLPVEQMSGNFIDAFFVDPSIYQVAICDIAGYDATSSFIGASLRTLIRSLSGNRKIPSGLIEAILARLTNVISTIKTKLNFTVFQLNTKTNMLRISSYGSLNTIYYTSRKNGIIHLNSTDIGNELSKKVGLRDISLTLDPGDTILYYSRGIISAAAENKSRFYDESMLSGQFLREIKATPMEISHSIIESLYSFVGFHPLNEDITLFCMTRTT